MKKVVLAYSGGLDTSVAIAWLRERDFDVIAVMADVGQDKDLKPAIARAKKAGVSKVVVCDLKTEFVSDYILPALKANAVYESQYLLATALSRPLIAKALVTEAHKEKASFVAHGCTGKGNDQVRFETSMKILDPDLKVIAPVREWELKSRLDEIRYAAQRGIPIDVTKKSPYSIDKNLWGVSIECGVLEDPWNTPPPDCYVWTKGAEKRSPKPAELTLTFEKGKPVALNGKRMNLLRLIAKLNQIGALYGIGRTDMIENRLVGIKSREIYESPAATLLMAAHRDLESIVLDRTLYQYKEGMSNEYARMIYNGLWFTPMKNAMDAFINETQVKVTGAVRVRISKLSFTVSGRKSPFSRYEETLATYSDKDEFDQTLAKGFIELYSLPYHDKK